MLDFYAIHDHQSQPEFPEELNLPIIGSITINSFKSLQQKGIIESKYNFHEDFRWDSLYVINKLESLKNSLDTDSIKLCKILVLAAKESAGLIAFCD